MNTYIKKEGYYEIHITENKNNGIILIDEEDYEKCKRYSWYIKDGSPNQYVACKIGTKTVKLHRYLLNIYDRSIIVDHNDRNTFNNRKYNLIPSDYFHNNRNSSFRKTNTTGRTGVIFQEQRGNHSARWFAQFGSGKTRKTKSFSLSKYSYEEAYNLAVKQREIWEKEFNITTEKVQRLSKTPDNEKNVT